MSKDIFGYNKVSKGCGKILVFLKDTTKGLENRNVARIEIDKVASNMIQSLDMQIHAAEVLPLVTLQIHASIVILPEDASAHEIARVYTNE